MNAQLEAKLIKRTPKIVCNVQIIEYERNHDAIIQAFRDCLITYDEAATLSGWSASMCEHMFLNQSKLTQDAT